MAKRFSEWYYSVPEEKRHSLRTVLSGMQQRCYNPKMHSFQDYGGRGIRICDEWYDEKRKQKKMEPFLKWALYNGYEDGLQIDRIDNNKGYYPSNCRFVSPMENGRNKRNCKPITYNGQTKCMSEWAEIIGIPKYIIRNRLKAGLPVERVLSPIIQQKDKQISIGDKKILLSTISKTTGLKRSLIRERLKRGWKIEDAISRKPNEGNSHLIEYNGEIKNKIQFAKQYNIRYQLLAKKMREGMELSEIIRKYGT